MKTKIDKKVKTVVTKGIEKYLNDSKMREYENASVQFEELIKKGVAKKRENNLASIVNIHRTFFNISNFSNNIIE